MINKLFKNRLLVYRPKAKFSKDHHPPAPAKLPKVSQKLIYLYIKNRDNVYQKVPAFEGESLLETIERMRVKAFQLNNCNGFDITYRPHFRPHDNFSAGPQCGGCRVVLEDNWFERVNRQTDGQSQQESFVLSSKIFDLQPNTRLACCIPIESWMNGMTLRVDPQMREGGLTEFF